MLAYFQWGQYSKSSQTNISGSGDGQSQDCPCKITRLELKTVKLCAPRVSGQSPIRRKAHSRAKQWSMLWKYTTPSTTFKCSLKDNVEKKKQDLPEIQTNRMQSITLIFYSRVGVQLCVIQLHIFIHEALGRRDWHRCSISRLCLVPSDVSWQFISPYKVNGHRSPWQARPLWETIHEAN